MRSSKLLSLTLLLALGAFTSCSKDPVQPASSSTGALTANSGLNFSTRPFEKRSFTGSGFNFLNEFIRADVRSRIDEEPVGDADSSYDPAASAQAAPDEPAADGSLGGESKGTEDQSAGEEASTPGTTSDAIRFSWATKAFGDAVKSNAGSTGFIVLYADENYYDINSMMSFVEDGRNRIADSSGIGGEKIQVVFGGYRATPQIEMWVMPDGSVPDFRPEQRPRS